MNAFPILSFLFTISCTVIEPSFRHSIFLDIYSNPSLWFSSHPSDLILLKRITSSGIRANDPTQSMAPKVSDERIEALEANNNAMKTEQRKIIAFYEPTYFFLLFCFSSHKFLFFLTFFYMLNVRQPKIKVCG